MFENQFISYYLMDNICVITYADNIRVDKEVAESIVAEKKRLQSIYPITRFIGVLNPTVSIDWRIMNMFSTEDALGDVTHIGIVFAGGGTIKKISYNIQVRLMNSVISILQRNNPIKMRFFAPLALVRHKESCLSIKIYINSKDANLDCCLY